jgi:hypothetical protein
MEPHMNGMLMSKETLILKEELFIERRLERTMAITGINFGISSTLMKLQIWTKDLLKNGECGSTDHSTSFQNSVRTDSLISSLTEPSSRPETTDQPKFSDSI